MPDELVVLDKDMGWKEFLSQPKYQTALGTISREYPYTKSLVIEYPDLESFGKMGTVLADELLVKPDKVIYDVQACISTHRLVPYFDSTGKDLSDHIGSDINIRFVGFPRPILIRKIRATHLNKYITVRGMVRRATDVQPRLTLGAFRCPDGHFTYWPQSLTTIQTPEKCGNADCKHGKLILVPERSAFTDAQRIRVQESPEGLRGGDQPQSIDIDITDDLCGIVSPGDIITINGILRSVQRKNTTSFDLCIECNSIETSVKGYDELDPTESELDQIKQLAADPEIYTKITQSIAPTIHGHETVKQAIALQLFGGTATCMPDGTRLRGDIHILLVGDPGIAKSQMLRYIVGLAPRGVYTAGKSASAAGLTATAVKDDMDGGRWTLEAGALVLADMGIAAIDEMDKMSDDDRSALHEAMEQQTISVSKAGINTSLQTRCALLAAANPKQGRFDPFQDIGDQINMPPSLLSRFDLIYILRANYDARFVKKLSNHILSVRTMAEYIHDGKEVPQTMDISMPTIEPAINLELLRKYIAYAKSHCNPKLSREAWDIIDGYYEGLCQIATDLSKPVPTTARQEEAIIRIAEASARIRLSDTVTAGDARRAVSTVDTCLREVAYDPQSGTIDIDKITTSTSKSARDKQKAILDAVKSVRGCSPSANRDKVIETVVSKYKYSKQDVEKQIQKLVSDGSLELIGNSLILL